MKSEYKQLFHLKGRTALVTGGAGFLGRHFSCGLAEFGANVAVVDLDLGQCNEVASQLERDYGIRVRRVPLRRIRPGIGAEIDRGGGGAFRFHRHPPEQRRIEIQGSGRVLRPVREILPVPVARDHVGQHRRHVPGSPGGGGTDGGIRTGREHHPDLFDLRHHGVGQEDLRGIVLPRAARSATPPYTPPRKPPSWG